jgi:hypothetical protein
MSKLSRRSHCASKNPDVRALFEQGKSPTAILLALGMAARSNTSNILGFVDPTPQPYGVPWDEARVGESGEQRAFRRFPIASHKPGS